MTHATTRRSLEAIVPSEKLAGKDRFEGYRAPGTAFLVGVTATVTYTVEADSPKLQGEEAQLMRVSYLYDLELDRDLKIIGGEWHANHHPDFLWRPRTGRALSIVDKKIDAGEWNTDRPVPPAWRKLAPEASAEKQPVAAIVEKMVELAR